jgi:hypothetical protein
MGGTGREHHSKSPEKAPLPEKGGTESGTLADDSGRSDLRQVIVAWPTLPAAVRAAIIAMIRANPA